ncbi:MULTISPECIES: CidA/LrgA family protein [unclassified Brenneria]|uniref:CidA/LrgA family protein n=1 Tax=unclassified Brenneria TaxID=2634434 RepID=UPI001553267F|nr:MULTISPECIES: CidA/LrgA family protein [unclassified Brenneria]MBJ7221246.1 CidA/LrgA family protein [Brenneria sp. L3-3C-1]MEE3642490.1 CidA/LrgA family protein [Brenneria sp. L3_3C_1]MEE3650146.1 CidA/LrgA family protein [Brenneria sp. HEZEL_4_2_4]NPD00105.1 CidA/LrgA family protein [Brenneria sp. hezel4-2-4]
MRNTLTLCWKYLRAFALIYLCLLAGNAISALLPLVIPGSIIGMLILFFLLAMQILPPDWVKPGCHLFIRHMALLFVPIGVGVMNYYDLLSQQFGPIVVSCLVSTFIVMIVVGYSTQLMQREQAISADNPLTKDKE